MPDYSKRLQNVQDQLEQDAYLIDNLTNLFYLTGFELSAGQLFVTQNDAYLIVDPRYYEMCRKKCNVPVVLTSEDVLLDLIKDSTVSTLAFDQGHTSFEAYHKLEEMVKKLSTASHNVKLVPIDDPVLQLRSIKDSEEIEILKQAADLGSEGFDFLCTQLEEDVSEVELAIELEIFWKRRGSKAIAFDPIIAFGSNSSMPHYHVGDAKLQKGQAVLMDIGVNLNHYHSDMTRMVFFGEPHPRMIEIYEIVKGAQEAALEKCKPGTMIGELDASAREFITSKGYGEQFTHSLGHGVGLEIHESPVLRNKPPHDKQPLQAGMVVTIEPGIYLPDLGGVRIEDTIVITDEGYENLTNRSKDLYVIS